MSECERDPRKLLYFNLPSGIHTNATREILNVLFVQIYRGVASERDKIYLGAPYLLFKVHECASRTFVLHLPEVLRRYFFRLRLFEGRGSGVYPVVISIG